MRTAAWACLLLVVSGGCAIKTGTLAHPNQINAIDSWCYDRLTEIQAGLDEAKAQLPKFPQYKDQLNQAGAAYNVARAAYAAYHNAGVANPADESKLLAEVQDLVLRVAEIKTAFSPPPKTKAVTP